ncbi:hypothetical protein OH456_03455 [Vibrio sp. La 4.2.2]|uniref:hypothetical protein n=1 Tax=Vibrio sp. La 4.2.2 TaxID=2998830 RepID=UPI0022CDFEC8|nr:hypothetical protein [Vibrio sp. La 4.2.2]MDA0107188.1 hypothetical protein [Vibrio sp. La 4.2.2]
MKSKNLLSTLVMTTLMSGFVSNAVAANASDGVQDMSDPLAVYTQAGAGLTDKGLNVKIGRAYDTGNDDTMAMNVLEIKGFAGSSLGWSGTSERDDSVDSVRFRNFTINTTNGLGRQIDLNYNVEQEALNTSYSFIQALPKWGGLQLYPLAGVGVQVKNGKFTGDKVEQVSSGQVNPDDQYIGYTLPGVYAVVGGYSKYSITDKLWVNYNPMWVTPLAGSQAWTDAGSVFTNEFVVSYQFTPRFNVRYFANWTHAQSYFDGDQRVEFNYQF